LADGPGAGNFVESRALHPRPVARREAGLQQLFGDCWEWTASAYSAYPFSACLEGAQIGSILPGPYVVPRFRCRTWSVATNKPPILPYRGVARTGVCYAMETTLDGSDALPISAIRLACSWKTNCPKTLPFGCRRRSRW
jgi:hypothetical protein